MAISISALKARIDAAMEANNPELWDTYLGDDKLDWMTEAIARGVVEEIEDGGVGPDLKRMILPGNVSSSSATPGDTGLSMEDLQSGTRYWFRAHLFKTEQSSGNGIGFDFSGLAMDYFYADYLIRRNSTGDGAIHVGSIGSVAEITFSSDGSTSVHGVTLQGTLKPSTTGDLSLRFRSSLNGQAVVLLEGSYIEWGELADVS